MLFVKLIIEYCAIRRVIVDNTIRQMKPIINCVRKLLLPGLPVSKFENTKPNKLEMKLGTSPPKITDTSGTTDPIVMTSEIAAMSIITTVAKNW